MTPGDYIEITYETYRCCPSDIDRIVGNLDGTEFFDTWEIENNLFDADHIAHASIDECGFFNNLNSINNTGPVFLDISTMGIEGPAQLTGPHNTTTSPICDADSRSLYEIPIEQFCDRVDRFRNQSLFTTSASGDVSGKLRVVITTESGLNPTMSPIDINIRDNFRIGSTTRTATTTIVTPYGATGAEINAEFNLYDLTSSTSHTYVDLDNFLDDAIFSFHINPCCNGLPQPNINVRFFIQPRTTMTGTSCVDCWIPIGEEDRQIQLHCPGCVTPGIIAFNARVRRETTGYPDDNDDGLADGTVPYTDMDAMLTAEPGLRLWSKRFIQGDVLSVNFSGKGQDGDNVGGVDYATLQSAWNTIQSTTDPAYPTAFTYINIAVTSPCITTYDMTPVVGSEVLTYTIASGTGTIALAPYRIACTTGSDFYRIPVSAFSGAFGMNDLYNFSARYIACNNGAATDCDFTTRMWWSAVPTHTCASMASVTESGAANASYIASHTSSTPIERATNALVPNLIYLCEAHGDMVRGFHIDEIFSSRWSNRNSNDDVACNKTLTNTITWHVNDGEDTRNLFKYEFRDLKNRLNTVNFTPPVGAPSYIFDNTRANTNLIVYNSSIAESHDIRNTLSPTGTYTLGTPAVWTMNPSMVYTPASYTSRTTIPATSNDIINGDERTSIELIHTFRPSDCCTSATVDISNATNSINTNANYCSSINTTRTIVTPTVTHLTCPNPSLDLQLISEPIDVYTVAPTTFDLEISNPTRDQSAENTYIDIALPAGATLAGTTPITDIITGLPYTYTRTGSIIHIEIGTLAGGRIKQIRVAFILNSCDRTVPNIVCKYGYTCTPTRVPRCSSTEETLNIRLTREPILLTGSITSPTPAILTPCMQQLMSGEFHVTRAGEVNRLLLSITVPTGVRITDPMFTIRELGGTSITLSALPPTPDYIISSTIVGGNIIYTYDFADGFILRLLPRINSNRLIFSYSIAVGACITASPISPFEIKLDAYSYCNQDNATPDVPPMTIRPTVNVIGTTTGCRPISITPTIINATCNGANNGSISLIITGTTTDLTIPPPRIMTPLEYTFQQTSPIIGGITRSTHMSSSTTPLVFSGLNPGTYAITVTDLYGCREERTYTVLPGVVYEPAIITGPYTSCDPTVNVVQLNSVRGEVYPIVTWTATNTTVTSGSASYVGGVYLMPITVLDPSLPAIVTVRYYHSNGTLFPICWDEISWTIYGCCTYNSSIAPLINNRTLSSLHGSLGFSSTGSTSGRSYRVNGVLTINDISPVFENCTFYMEPYSEIKVLNGKTLTLNSCVFVACDNVMWKGFNLEAGSHLIAQRSTGTTNDTRIYDALVGITSWGGADYDLNGVTMNRNYIDIDVKPYTTASHPSTIELSNLYCHIDAPIEYHGASLPPRDGTLWTPHTGELSFMGIQENDVKELTVGKYFYTWADLRVHNRFEDKVYGIKSFRSGLNVYQCDFYNMRCEFSNTDGSCRSGGDGINHTGFASLTGAPYEAILHVEGQFCTGNNIFRIIKRNAIYATGKLVHGTVFYNDIEAKFGIQMINIEGNLWRPTMNIYGNQVVHQNGGINFTNASYQQILIGNNGVGNLNTTPSGVKNISIESAVSSSAPVYNIYKNGIYGGNYGIYINNVNFGGVTLVNTIDKNVIRSLATNPSLTNFRGVNLVICSNTKVSCNRIDGITTDISASNKSAIVFENSPLNKIENNRMNNLRKGLVFFGACDMPNSIGANFFRSLDIGIFSSPAFPLTRIGDQLRYMPSATYPPVEMPGNMFLDIPSMTNTINFSGVPFKYKYTIATEFDPKFPSSMQVIPSTLRSSIYMIATLSRTNYPANIDCDYNPDARMRDTTQEEIDTLLDINNTEYQFAEMIASDDITYMPDEEGAKLIDELNAYELVKQDSSLLDDDSIALFMREKEEAHIGVLYDTKNDISKEDYLLAQSKLSTISQNDYAEVSNKIVFTLYNDFIQRDTPIFTEDELLILLEEANHCPIRHGSAVYIARTLVNTQAGHENDYWYDEDICIEGSSFKRANPNTEEEIATINKTSIYPNPAKEKLNYILSNSYMSCDKVIINVKSITGELIISKDINPKNYDNYINIVGIADGTYFIEFICDTNNEIFKFIVNK